MINNKTNIANNTFVPPHQLCPIQEISVANQAPGKTNNA
jgi:hypothetical protein